MKRPQRHADGKYHIGGKTFDQLIGSRAQVWHGTAYKTSGGLPKDKLVMNKHGRIVSKKKHATAKREKRLEKAGYKTRKGHFGAIKGSPKRKSSRRKSRKSRKSRR